MTIHIPTLSPLKTSRGSATERVFDALYIAVISVKLPPGTKVSEVDVARQLDVSRQPVRDAFFRLSNLGFLSIRAQRPTLITQISLRAIHDAVFTRTALEVECLREAVVKNKAHLVEGMRANIADQELALLADTAAFHAIDEAFHELICAVSGHDHIWPLIREQKGHLDRLRFLSLSQERRQHVIAEHRKILEAILKGDTAQAEKLLREHISAIKDILPTIVERYPDYCEIA
ncbi:GntR family transcriptional regulator [Sulfitobacter sp. SK012]|uniref:GntR family transcriptional regulator n=1 Tax=Sulfitobacter sp. SK012 TaxID=1389005 RepID=UPI000E0AD0FF|nr:GntR family transcriptional regulator [Sulfitobacter sp. SK012]AXI48194.1 GntR family transcriptional regulator [Sulfitobacter sp. SK012]